MLTDILIYMSRNIFVSLDKKEWQRRPSVIFLVGEGLSRVNKGNNRQYGGDRRKIFVLSLSLGINMFD